MTQTCSISYMQPILICCPPHVPDFDSAGLKTANSRGSFLRTVTQHAKLAIEIGAFEKTQLLLNHTEEVKTYIFSYAEALGIKASIKWFLLRFSGEAQVCPFEGKQEQM